MALRAVIVCVLAIPAIAISYYFLVSLPAYNRAVLDLEKQKYVDQKAKEEISTLAKESQDRRATELATCASDVQRQYENDLKRNRTAGNNGGYTLDLQVLAQIERRKEAAINECHKLGK